jgi:hypothetical protein
MVDKRRRRQAFSVMWRGEVVGAHRGVALRGHYTRRYRPLSLVHALSPGGGRIPGFDLAGFHYYQSVNLRLIGVPLCFPSGVCLVVLGVAVRWWRRQRRRPGCCLVCGYSLTGNVSGVSPECGTPACGRLARLLEWRIP